MSLLFIIYCISLFAKHDEIFDEGSAHYLRKKRATPNKQTNLWCAKRFCKCFHFIQLTPDKTKPSSDIKKGPSYRDYELSGDSNKGPESQKLEKAVTQSLVWNVSLTLNTRSKITRRGKCCCCCCKIYREYTESLILTWLILPTFLWPIRECNNYQSLLLRQLVLNTLILNTRLLDD